MSYSYAFFEFQINVARFLTHRFDLSLEETIHTYTFIPTAFSSDNWDAYTKGLNGAIDPVEWTYEWYLAREIHEPASDDTDYYGYPLFGCFWYFTRDQTVIRPQFVKNDLPDLRPLGYERVAARRNELRRMFAHIKEHIPSAQQVMGRSWMYNLPSYCRLFPAEYTANMSASNKGHFQYLALWGQCFDRDWRLKEDVACGILQRCETLHDPAQLHLCFPYQTLEPSCHIEAFYAFYDIA